MDTLYRQSADGRMECLLCPHLCKLAEGKTGICGVRKNSGDRIELLTYGILSGIALDPIEKKPLYHFFPGSNILSIGSWGCNMRCDFCQNYQISQEKTGFEGHPFPPADIIDKALTSPGNIGVAFTYNEPVIWYEFVRDTSLAAKQAGLMTVMVTNGFVSEAALSEFISFIDAFNVDLKAFSNSFYRELTGSELEPVKRALRMIAGSGKHLEITTLVIPGRNDDPDEMENEAKWIASELGRNIPFHLSRYFPMYRRDDPATPEKKLEELYTIASSFLDHVYLGNTRSGPGQDTTCPECGKLITERSGYRIRHSGTKDGTCTACSRMIYEKFTFSSSSKHH